MLLEVDTYQDLNLCINQSNHFLSGWEKPFSRGQKHMLLYRASVTMFFFLFRLLIVHAMDISIITSSLIIHNDCCEASLAPGISVGCLILFLQVFFESAAKKT